VLTLAYSVLCGGTRLEDFDRLRNDVPLMNGLGQGCCRTRHDGGTSCAASRGDLLTLMDAINSVRPALWLGRGADLLGEVAYLDVDGTIVATTGRAQQGMTSPTRAFGAMRRLLVTLANTRRRCWCQPAGQRAQPPGRRDLDRQGDPHWWPPYTKRVCVRGTPTRADRHFAGGEAGRLRPGHG